MFLNNDTRGSNLLSLQEKVMKTRNYQERSIPKFLKKVFHIVEENKFNEYVSWSNDGMAITIKKPTEFAEKVLPLYFKHSNLASFIRQLNMYNFKKRKNYHYDHVYGHEMFQHGRIDLLKNIQRKSAETTSTETNDKSKDDLEVDVETLINENIQYKRVHKTLSTQLQFIDGKMRDLKNEIQTLHSQHRQQKANEAFLKNVVKNLSTLYGVENIQKAIEAASYASSLSSELDSSACEPIESRYTQSGIHNSTLGQGYNQNTSYSQADGSHYFGESKSIFHNKPVVNNFDNVLEDQGHNIESINHYEQGVFETNEFEQRNDNDKSSDSDTYMSWYEEYEKKQLGADSFLGNHNLVGQKNNGNLDIDGTMSSYTRLLKTQL